MTSTSRQYSKRTLLTIAFAISNLQKAIAYYDGSDQFSSSIVTTSRQDDISLGLRRPDDHVARHDTITNHKHTSRDGERILHSFIDRDPIYHHDNDFDISSSPTSESSLFSMEQTLFSPTQNDMLGNSWKSPLESIAPLPSLSLNNRQTQSTPMIDVGPSHLIRTGPRHTHEIDVSTTTTIHNFQNSPQLQQSNLNHPSINPRFRSTGTTITALLACNNTVLILASDTRATDGSTVADKRCEKLHRLAQNIWCAGAGTSADVEAIVRKTKFVFWKRGVLMGEGMGVGNMGNTCEGVDIDLLNKGLDGNMIDDGEGEDDGIPMASVPSVLHYLRTQLQQSRGALGVNLLVGGYDVHSHRATLAAVHPHGSMDIVTYAALGSGGLAATGVLESKYPVIGCGGCSVEEGIRLAVDAVRAGIDNDLGSGSQVDVCVVGREGVVYRRGVVREEELEWLSDDEGVTTPNEDGEKTNRDFLTSGVNGFGNVPFAIQSRRVIFSGENGADRERRKWLDGVVGTK